MPNLSITFIIGILFWFIFAYSLYILTYAICMSFGYDLPVDLRIPPPRPDLTAAAAFWRALWPRHPPTPDAEAVPSYLDTRLGEVPRLSRYHDGIREVTFIPASKLRPLTTGERIRHGVEMRLGHTVNWHPLAPLPPLCGPNGVVVYWRVSEKALVTC